MSYPRVDNIVQRYTDWSPDNQEYVHMPQLIAGNQWDMLLWKRLEAECLHGAELENIIQTIKNQSIYVYQLYFEDVYSWTFIFKIVQNKMK